MWCGPLIRWWTISLSSYKRFSKPFSFFLWLAPASSCCILKHYQQPEYDSTGHSGNISQKVQIVYITNLGIPGLNHHIIKEVASVSGVYFCIYVHHLTGKNVHCIWFLFIKNIFQILLSTTEKSLVIRFISVCSATIQKQEWHELFFMFHLRDLTEFLNLIMVLLVIAV